MAKVPNIIPITDLRQDAASVLRRVRHSKQPVVITQLCESPLYSFGPGPVSIGINLYPSR